MSQIIKLKRSAVAGRIPAASSLDLGEIAINTYDGKLYIKKDVAGVEEVVEVGKLPLNPSFDSVFLAGAAGPIVWNTVEEALDIPLNDEVTLQVGQEQVFRGKATEVISNGDVVMFAGAQGDHLLIAKADMSVTGFRPEHVIGLATQDFANNEFGFVTSFGKVRGLDTTAFNEGDILYLDAANPGALTTAIPAPPNHSIQLCAVVRSHGTQGTYLVRPMHFPDTDEIVEGLSNLYFTNARAVAAVAAADQYVKNTGDTVTGNVTLDSSANLIFRDKNGTFPTNSGKFVWDLNNDSAAIYAQQPSSDQIDFFFKITDNAASTDRFVFWIDDYRGAPYDKYPAQLDGSGVYLSVPVSASGVKDLANSRMKIPYSGNPSIDNNTIWHAGNFNPNNYLLTSNYVDDYVTSAAFNITNGILTLTRAEGGTVAVDLDGRYSQTDTSTTYSVSAADVASGKAIRLTGSNSVTDDVILAGGNNVSLTRSGDTITINSADAPADVVTTLSKVGNDLRYVNEAGTTATIDLTSYLDDTNLARIVDGTLSGSGILTVTRDDSTTFDIDLSLLLDDTNLARIVSAGWNTGNGVLTLTRNDGSTIPVDLDNRYLQSYTETDTLQSVTARGNNTNQDIILDGSASLIFNTNQQGLGGEVGLRGNGEGFDIYEPEESSKIWLTIADDPQGNNNAFKVNSSSGMQPVWHGGNLTPSDYLLASNYVDDYVTSAAFNTTNGILTLTRAEGGAVTVDLDGRYLQTESDSQTLSWNGATGQLSISNGNTVDLDNRYYTKSEGDSLYVNVTGDTMTGSLNFTGDEDGITWSRNTDGASILFYNDADGDTNSRLEFNINDNTNEDFLFTYTTGPTTYDLVRMSPDGGQNGFKFRNNTVWHAGNFNPSNYLLTSNYQDNYVDSLAFNTSNGILTLGRTGSLPDLTVDLDNRYKIKDNTYRWKADLPNYEGSRYYKLATVNRGNGGLRIEGTFSNHVESFGTQTVDLSIFGRENDADTEIEIIGSIDVAASGTGTGIYAIKATDSGTYHTYDIYAVVPKYAQIELELTKTGVTSVHLPSESDFVTTKPTGISVELDASTLSEGSYVVQGSEIYENYHAGNINPVTGLSHDTIGRDLDITFADGTTQTVDLSQYVDDTNLARITSGSIDSNGIAKFTRDDGTFINVNMSAFFDDTDSVDYINGASFNTGNGVLTLSGVGRAGATVDLDNRYLTSYAETDTLQSVTGRGNTTTNQIVVNKDGYGLLLKSATDGGLAGIQFTSNPALSQIGHISYSHYDSQSYGANESFTIGGTELSTVILADGQFYYKDGIYKKPTTGTGAGTRKDVNWDAAYSWGNHADAGYIDTIPDSYVRNTGDTMTGDLTIGGNKIKSNDSYYYIPYISGGIGTRSELISAANLLLHADTDGSGTTEFVSIRAGAGTANELKLLSKTSTAGVNNQALTLNGNKVFNDAYHPNADKWTTARSHTVTLTGDVTGSASQSVDGTGNRTWTISTAVSNDSHNHDHSDGGFQVNGKLKVTAGADIVSTSSNPFRWQRSSLNQTGQDDNVTVHLDDSNIYFTHNNDSDGDASGYNFRYMSGGGAQNLVNFSSSAFTYKGNNVFHDTYHPNADKWTTARTNTVALSGDVTGSGSASVDGTGNWTVNVSTAVANDSHNHTYFDVSNITDLNSVPNVSDTRFRPFVSNFQAANRSGSNYNGGFEVGLRATGYRAQLVFEADINSGPKFRIRNSTGFGSWKSIWHSGNFNPSDYLLASNYVDTDNYVDSVTFNTSNGVLTLGRTGSLSNLTVDLDGRYQSTLLAPVAPSITSTSIVDDTIEVVFSQSSTSGVESYEVWSDLGIGSYSLIAKITDEDFAASMSVIDTTFKAGTVNYRVFAIKHGVYSSAATTSRVFTSPSLDVTSLQVLPDLNVFYIGYNIPESRFVDHVEIYVDTNASSSGLARANASLIYSGNNSNYTYNISASERDAFHQFWVEVL